MKTIKDFNPKDKTILMRVDYNVPLKDGKITDDLRIRASLPTINYFLDHGAKQIFLISHLGRPKGQNNPEFSLSPVAKALQKLLPETKIAFLPLPADENSIKAPDNTKIALLENLRFDPGEEANDPDFIQKIVQAANADVYVQDGFAVVHRAHASTDAVKKFLPIYAGLLLENEIKNLQSATKNPPKPVLLIIGGAKVEDKQPLIDKFINKADCIFVGGKIAADGYKAKHPKIIVASDFDTNENGDKLDIGPLSTGELANLITDASTIIWNGALGYVEDPAYTTASTIAAELIGEKSTATTIICGGDTTGFVENLMREHKNLEYSLVSTGGGAALEFLLGKKLPGIAAIKD